MLCTSSLNDVKTFSFLNAGCINQYLAYIDDRFELYTKQIIK